MIFHQITTLTVTPEQLVNLMLCNASASSIQKMYFAGYPDISDITDALRIIESKRTTLDNPTRHSFLCLELRQEDTVSHAEQFNLAKYVADSINHYFDDDLFIMAVFYQDTHNIPHFVVIISDIEKSLSAASSFHLTDDVLYQILADSLPEHTITDFYYSSLYLLNGEANALAYDGVIHVCCRISKK